ncbi:MAG: FtsB family cell division protein [Dethiobacteria bacterium]|jgi:cell division protein DivIC
MRHTTRYQQARAKSFAFTQRLDNNQQREKAVGRRFNKQRLLTLVLCLIFLYLLTVIVEQSFVKQQYTERLADLEEKVAIYEEENESLRQELKKLVDLDYIELLARQRLGMVRPGEIIFQFEEQP